MSARRLKRAFTLVEMLLVIAIISILAAMAIGNFSNASQDTREIMSRQQLAVVQEALNQYVNKEIGRVTTSGGAPKSMSKVRDDYNAASGVARYNLFAHYLDEATRASINYNEETNRITTQAMRDSNHYMTLPNWEAETAASPSLKFPKVRFD